MEETQWFMCYAVYEGQSYWSYRNYISKVHPFRMMDKIRANSPVAVLLSFQVLNQQDIDNLGYLEGGEVGR